MPEARRQQDLARERLLVVQARLGDDAAFGDLFEMYRRPIFRLCLDRLEDAGLAEDAVQDTFMRAHAAIARFDLRRRFFPWLATIAVHRAEDLRRHERLQRPYGLVPDSVEELSGDVASIAIDRHRLAKALSLLPATQRRMVLRHDLEGWSCREVADQEGKSELAVRSSLCRARASLRAFLEALGLAGAAVRDLWRRARDSAQRINATPLADLSGAAYGIGMIVGSAAVSVILTVSAIDGARRIPRTTSAGGMSGATITATRSTALRAETSPVATRARLLDTGTVRVSSSRTEHRDGGTLPSRGTLGYVVVGPDGTILLYGDTELECSRIGEMPALPDASPVRAVC